MSIYRVNKHIILRTFPTTIYYKRDCHPGMSSSLSSPKRVTFKTSPRRIKSSQKKNAYSQSDLRKSMATSIIPGLIKNRGLTNESGLLKDYKKKFIDLSVLHFDKVKDVTNKIKNDLLSVNEVVKELISFKKGEYDRDDPIPPPRIPNMDYNFGQKIRQVAYEKEADEFDEKPEKNLKNNKNQYIVSKQYMDEDDENASYNTGRKRLKNQTDINNELHGVPLKNYRRIVPQPPFESKDESELQQVRNELNYAINDRTTIISNFASDLIPIDDTMKELIGFKKHEKFSPPELSDVDNLVKKKIPFKKEPKQRRRNDGRDKKINIPKYKYMDEKAYHNAYLNSVKELKLENKKNLEKMEKYEKIEEIDKFNKIGGDDMLKKKKKSKYLTQTPFQQYKKTKRYPYGGE